jgi:outer membrane biosynthesis protein TonB
MLPQTQKRKPRNSTKVNLLLSIAFHGAIIVTLVYFAAREGLLGKQFKKIAVEMVKEKPPEKPKEVAKPKNEPPKLEHPKLVQAPKVEERKMDEPKPAPEAPPASVAVAPPAFAPPSVDVPSFVFEGGKAVETSSDPVQIYKSLVESSLRSRWNRPEEPDDHAFVAEVEVSVDSSGQIVNPVWKKSSGNKAWDDSVRQALASAGGVDRPPPAHFPSRVVIRFDVVPAEPIVQ